MPMVEDLSAFFELDEHATLAVLDGAQVQGIFDRAYAAVLDGISTTTPTFVLPTASAPHVTQASRLRIIGGAEYRISAIEPDGTGVTMLLLERV